MLKALLLSTALAAGTVTALPGQARAQAIDMGDALDLACEFVRAFPQGTDAVVDVLAKQPTVLNAKVIGDLGDTMRKQIGGLAYVDARPFLVADLPGHLREYLITVSIENNKLLYVRTLYEAARGKVTLVNFVYNDRRDKILQVPLMQAPEPVSCPG